MDTNRIFYCVPGNWSPGSVGTSCVRLEAVCFFRTVAKSVNISTDPSRWVRVWRHCLTEQCTADFVLKVRKGTKSVFSYCLLGLLTLNLEAVRSSETSITLKQSTQYLCLHEHRCENRISGRGRSQSAELCVGLGTGGPGRATVLHALPMTSASLSLSLSRARARHGVLMITYVPSAQAPPYLLKCLWFSPDFPLNTVISLNSHYIHFLPKPVTFVKHNTVVQLSGICNW